MKRKILSVLLGCTLCFTLALSACGKTERTYSGSDYAYTRESTTNMLKFSSSDSSMADFLNDYLHRHLRYDDKRIDFRDLGSSVTFGKEWESKSLMFFDSTDRVLPTDRVAMIKSFLSDVPVDRFGYVWNAQHSVQESDVAGNVYFAQGWPFPAYSTVNNAGARGWEFASASAQDWTTALNGKAIATVVEDNPYHDGKLMVEAQSTDVKSLETVEFISPQLQNNGINCAWAPFLELDLRLTDTSSSWGETFFDDIEVWWTHAGEDWSADRKVNYTDFATTGDMELSSTFNRHLYFPMYLNDEWGTSGKASDRITQLKIVVKGKKKPNVLNKGTVKLNFVRAQFDTRQSNNIGIFLTTARQYLSYTGDTAFLEENLPRFRKAAQFMLGYLKGSTGLITLDGFVGHDGGTTDQIGSSIGNGYWDMLSTPTVSFYANVFFYRAMESMLAIERMAAENGIEQEMPTVWNDTATESVSYADQMTQESLAALCGKIKTEIQKPVDTENHTGFWDEEKGRFIEGFDMFGDVIDYGYTMYNLEAIDSGVATEAQATAILDWINGDRTVASDVNETNEQSFATGKRGSAAQKNGSIDITGTLGIYDYEFAPRVSTVKNTDHYYWDWSSQDYAMQLQDGGATMYVSYYDIMSRLKYRDSADAYGRLTEIKQWYQKVQAAAAAKHAANPGGGYDGKNFYAAYYEDLGLTLQGTDESGAGGAGSLGLSYEFLESSLLYATVPYGFFGIDADGIGTLSVSPELPASVDWFKMENLLFSGVYYDCSVSDDMVQIDYVRGNSKNLNLKIALPVTDGQKLYLDGKLLPQDRYTVSDGKATVTVPFKACKVTAA